jgi:hypothetical protein
LKNYDNEIELFLNFLEPWINDKGFIGYQRYENCGLPTLIFMEDEKIKTKECL